MPTIDPTSRDDARLQLALDAAAMGSFVWYPREDRGEPDARMLALFGLPADDPLTLRDALATLIHSADRDRYAAAVARALDPVGGGELREEIRVVHPDGAERWLAVTGRVTFAGDPPRAARMDGVAADVTTRKAAEEVLRASEARFRALATAGADVLYRMSPDWSEMRELDGRAFLADVPASDAPVARGAWLGRYIAPDDQARVTTAIEQAVRTRQTFVLEHRVIRADGTLGWTHSRAVPLVGADGAVIEWIGAASDVTAWKEAEEGLRESETRYRTLFETMREGFVVCEAVRGDDGTVTDFRYVDVNPALERLTGFAVADVLGRRFSEVFPPDEGRYWVDAYARVLASGVPAHVEQFVASRDRWFAVDLTPRGGDRIAVLYENVTERKRAEAALRASEARQSFLLRLNDTLRPLADPTHVQAAAAELLGIWFGASRAFYTEVAADGDHAIIRADYAVGVPSIVGEIRIHDFGAFLASSYRAGQTVVVADTGADARFAASERAVLAASAIGAFVGVPLVKGDRLAAVFGVNTTAARAWTPAEVALVEDVAERTWAAVERARAESALRESEMRAAAIVAHLPGAAAFIVNHDLRYLMAGGQALHASGLTAANFVGRTLDEVLPPEVAADYALRYRQTLAGDSFVIEHTEHGRTWVTRGVPLHDDAGRIYAALAVSYDVTELRAAETALRESEERYRLIVDSARDYAIFTTDLGGRIETWSPGAEGAFGWTAAEAIGEPMELTYVPDDNARQVAAHERAEARTHGVAANIRWHQRRDGTRVFIEGAARPLYDARGVLRGYLKLGQDITRRRQTEDALRESEARFRAVANLVPDLLWESDPDGSTPWYNDQWKLYTGQTNADAVGWGWTDAIHPDDRATSASNYAAAMETGRMLQQTHRIRRADGTYRWFLVRAEPLRDDQGRIVRWFGAATDVHEQRVALEAAERARRDVERRVAERTAELAEANARLAREVAERTQLRRQLASAEEDERRRLSRELHDELGQHLTGLTLGIDSARRLVAEGAAAALLDQLHARTLTMVSDVRALTLALRPPELDDVGFESAVDTYVREWAARTGLSAEVEVTGVVERSLPLDVRTTLYRVVQEALTNVARHSGATRVSVLVDKPDGEVRLIVEDDGRGFDVDATAERVRAERRLGLAGMRERAALVGGTLTVESSPGAGTTIYVRAPIKGPKEPS